MAGDSQYKKIKDFDDLLWGLDSPAAVEKMVLSYDRLRGVNVLQITFRNVSQDTLFGLRISLDLKDSRGRVIYKDVAFNYYAMNVASGKTFGEKEDIVVESDAENFEVTVTGADLPDGRRFHAKVPLERIEKPLPLMMLGEYEGLYIGRYTKLYPKAKLICAPEERKDYWYCGCGRMWPNTMTRCLTCKINRIDLFSILPTLKEEEAARKAEEARKAQEAAEKAAEEERLAAEKRKAEEAAALLEEARREQEEAERKAEEERLLAEAERARKKRMRKIAMAGSIAAALCLMCFIIIPQIREYHQGRFTDVPNDVPPSVVNNQATTGSAVDVEVQTKPPKTEHQASEPSNPAQFENSLFLVGEDVGGAGLKTLWRLFGTSEDALESLETRSIGAAQAHTYLDYEIGRDNVEKKAVSSVLIMPTTSGGINLRLFNINYFTEEDYRKQLLAMGLENAEVIIAAPSEVSGSTAMIGLMLYEASDCGKNFDVIGTGVAKMNMNVRRGPSLDAEICGAVPKGGQVEIIEEGERRWYKIIWPSSELGFAYTNNYNNEYYVYSETAGN